MEYRKEIYKTRLTSYADRRARRSERLTNARIDERTKLLNTRRGAIEDAIEDEMPGHVEACIEISTKVLPPPSPLKKKSRAEMLQEWKLLKVKRLEEMKKKQKPIFKVGVIQRKATGSPLINISNTINNKTSKALKPVTKTEAPGVITRARAKILKPAMTPPKSAPFLRAVKNKMKPISRHNFVVPKSVALLPTLTIPSSPKITKSVRKGKKPELIQTPILNQINFDVGTVIKQNKKVEEIEMDVTSTSDEMNNLEDKMKNVTIPKTPENEITSTKPDYVPIHYSPYVTMERGSGKKTQRNSKIHLTMDVNKQIEKEEKEFECRIFSFRKFVECETNRLLGKCEEWEKINGEQNFPEDVKGEINAVIGKTKLLTSDKFKQFKDLIEKCHQKDPMIKVDDLQGFQDWVSIEVDNVDAAFAKLDEGKQNNFKKKEAKPKIVKSTVNKENKIPAKLPVGKSNIRAHILAARKLLRQNATDLTENSTDLSPLRAMPTWSEALSSPKKTPKRKESLMKTVLTSETKKKHGGLFDSPRTPQRQSSAFEIIAATQKAKTLTPGKSQESETETQSSCSSSTSEASFINTKSTPGKGILKSASCASSSKKSKVVFKFGTSSKSSPFENRKPTPNRISEKYFAPPEENEESMDCDSPIRMRDNTPTRPIYSSSTKRRSRVVTTTPVRKSARLANK